MRGVVAMGYENPSTIQKRAIPALLQGKDVLGQAASGCGKTAALVLPLLHTLATAGPTVRQGVNGLVLLPTKGLAIQVAEAVESLGKFVDGLQVVVLVGGDDIKKDLQNKNQKKNKTNTQHTNKKQHNEHKQQRKHDETPKTRRCMLVHVNYGPATLPESWLHTTLAVYATSPKWPSYIENITVHKKKACTWHTTPNHGFCHIS